MTTETKIEYQVGAETCGLKLPELRVPPADKIDELRVAMAQLESEEANGE